MRKRKLDQTGDGPLSAFAFKAKQAPLRDSSNRNTTDRPILQPPNRHNGTVGNCPKKPKAMVTALPSVPRAKFRKRRNDPNGSNGSNGLPKSDKMNHARHVSKSLPTSDQISSVKTSDTSEGLRDEGDSSNPSGNSPRLSSETWLSTFKPTPQNVTEKRDSLSIHLQEGDTLAVLGQYDLYVQQGAVSLMGAILHAGSTAYRVHAPATHALPLIRCVPDPFSSTNRHSQIELFGYEDGLPLLGRVSTRFGGIWNGNRTLTEGPTPDAQRKERSFTPIYDIPQNHLRKILYPLHVSEQWGSLISKLSTTEDRSVPKIMVCGPKGTGKSTFSRLASNSMLSKAGQRRRQSKGHIDDGVALLDLDPGQPEFSPPGEVSLVHLRTFVFGSPFTHPVLGSVDGNQLIRAHHVAAISPKDDPDHYLACALELMKQYRRLLQRNSTCPLVVNCSGWIYGSGLEVLTELIQKLGITDVVYMSEAGQSEIVDELVSATHKARIPFHMLPSQPSEYAIRLPSDLRAMQSLSYFHLAPSVDGHISWDHRPITSMVPWTVRYAGPDQGVLGIMVMGERQDPDCLAELLDGALVGVVAVDDDSAIPAQGQDYIADGKGAESMDDQGDGTGRPDLDNCAIYQFPNFEADADDSEIEDMHASKLPFSSSPIELLDPDDMEYENLPIDPAIDHPSVLRTANEHLPYLFSGQGTCTPLDPKGSHSLGLALIRGIDKQSQTLHLITPIPASTIDGFHKHQTKIVLVKGKLDTPAWAYQEEYCAATAAEQRRMELKDGDAMDGLEDGEIRDRRPTQSAWEGGVPWVRVLNGPEGRGRGAKVWRVRRDLRFMGNSDDGMSD